MGKLGGNGRIKKYVERKKDCGRKKKRLENDELNFKP